MKPRWYVQDPVNGVYFRVPRSFVAQTLWRHRHRLRWSKIGPRHLLYWIDDIWEPFIGSWIIIHPLADHDLNFHKTYHNSTALQEHPRWRSRSVHR